MRNSVMICILILMASTGCSKYDFDGFDPTTATVRWIMKHDLKRTSVHTKPSASPCTATDEAVSNRGGVEPLPSCRYVHGKHGG